MKDVKVKGLFRNVKYPIRLYDKNGNLLYRKNSNGYSWINEYDKNGNEIYFRNSDGFSCIKEYDKNGNEIYFENSNGIIIDKRPKKKYTIKELEKLTGINNIEIVKE